MKKIFISKFCGDSYCMVFAYVRKDNPRARASGLPPVHTHNHTIISLIHQHACAYNFLNSPACMCILYIVKYLILSFEYHSKHVRIQRGGGGRGSGIVSS